MRGVVLDDTGEPVRGATIALGRARSRSAADGRFSIAGGGAVLSAYHPRLGNASVELVDYEDKGRIRVALEPAAPPLVLSLKDANEALLPDVRLVPIDASGRPNPLAPHWRCCSASEDGTVVLPAGLLGSPLAAIDKDGTELGRANSVRATESGALQVH